MLGREWLSVRGTKGRILVRAVVDLEGEVVGEGREDLARLDFRVVGERLHPRASKMARRGRRRRFVVLRNLLAFPQRHVAVICEPASRISFRSIQIQKEETHLDAARDASPW